MAGRFQTLLVAQEAGAILVEEGDLKVLYRTSGGETIAQGKIFEDNEAVWKRGYNWWLRNANLVTIPDPIENGGLLGDNLYVPEGLNDGEVLVAFNRPERQSMASMGSTASVSSTSSRASAGSEGEGFSRASQPSIGSSGSFGGTTAVASIGSAASQATRANIASNGSMGSASSIAARSSVSAQASHGSTASVSAVASKSKTSSAGSYGSVAGHEAVSSHAGVAASDDWYPALYGMIRRPRLEGINPPTGDYDLSGFKLINAAGLKGLDGSPSPVESWEILDESSGQTYAVFTVKDKKGNYNLLEVSGGGSLIAIESDRNMSFNPAGVNVITLTGTGMYPSAADTFYLGLKNNYWVEANMGPLFLRNQASAHTPDANYCQIVSIEIDDFSVPHFQLMKATQLVMPCFPEIITEATTSRTLTAADVGRRIRCTNASATTITAPPTSTLDLPKGIPFFFTGVNNNVTFSPGSGVTINDIESVTNFRRAVLVPVGTDEYDLHKG